MKIVEIAPQSREDQLIENLVELWKNSVRATHLFFNRYRYNIDQTVCSRSIEGRPSFVDR